RLIIHCATIGVLVSSVPNTVWAGSTGRRNTAIAATAVAAGAWSNGTGKAGRRNTALLATGGAVYAWSRYHDKKKQENRRKVVVLERGRAVDREGVYVRHETEGQRDGGYVAAQQGRE